MRERILKLEKNYEEVLLSSENEKLKEYSQKIMQLNNELEMLGSEKQIAWAKERRFSYISNKIEELYEILKNKERFQEILESSENENRIRSMKTRISTCNDSIEDLISTTTQQLAETSAWKWINVIVL